MNSEITLRIKSVFYEDSRQDKGYDVTIEVEDDAVFLIAEADQRMIFTFAEIDALYCFVNQQRKGQEP